MKSQDPVCEVECCHNKDGLSSHITERLPEGTPLYLAPQPIKQKDTGDLQDLVSKALNRAWQLGKIYWQQVDSEYQSQWKKGEATQEKFNLLVEETRAAIDEAMEES